MRLSFWRMHCTVIACGRRMIEFVVVCCSAEINVDGFLSSLETSYMLGLEDLNYDSVFDHQFGEEEAKKEELPRPKKRPRPRMI